MERSLLDARQRWDEVIKIDRKYMRSGYVNLIQLVKDAVHRSTILMRWQTADLHRCW